MSQSLIVCNVRSARETAVGRPPSRRAHVLMYCSYIPIGTGDSTLTGTLILMSWSINLDDVGVAVIAVAVSRLGY